jgi:hypothetical protein
LATSFCFFIFRSLLFFSTESSSLAFSLFSSFPICSARAGLFHLLISSLLLNRIERWAGGQWRRMEACGVGLGGDGVWEQIAAGSLVMVSA